MKNISKLTQIFWIGLIILLFSFCVTDVAAARGGCFAGGTAILTTEGYKPIEQLDQSDRIIGYNFTTHHPEEGNIGEIQVLSSPGYFLINDKIKVTESHPFYIKTSTGVKVVKAQKLKPGDQLVGEESHPVISSLEYVNKPITVYNLISVSPNHNFYADGILVHNKGGGGGGGGGGGYGGARYGGHGNSSVIPINSKTLPKIILVSIILIFALLPIIFLHEISNFVRFFGNNFTNDLDLIDFTTSVNSKFTNQYSNKYSKDNELWNLIPLELELEPQQYQQFVNKSELIEQVRRLFIQYQIDWTKKDFDHMKNYVVEPFYFQQYDTFCRDFGNNFDIIYSPELLDSAPINYTQAQNRHIFRVQVNAKMINFVLSPQGYVLSGESYPRSFSEYWDICVDSEENWYLMAIIQAKKP